MGRRASGRRKKGKCVRRAKIGQSGLMMSIDALKNADASDSKKSRKYAKRQQARLEKRFDRMDQEDDVQTAPTTSDEKVPKTFVFHRGKAATRNLMRLARDTRKCMEPYTATKLESRKRNQLKDFVTHGPSLGVSHMLVFTKSDNCINMRLMKLPQGPTLTFQVLAYSLCGEIASKQKRQLAYDKQLLTAPIVVMNDFAGAAAASIKKEDNNAERANDTKHLSIAQTALQHVFPRLKVDQLQISKVRRAILLNYDAESDSIEWRHYLIRSAARNLTKGVKKVVAPKTRSKIPDLSKCVDISDLVTKPEMLSESEWEDDDVQEIKATENIAPARGITEGTATAVRLTEIGPRMRLRLVKVEEGIQSGLVLYHRFEHRAQEEVKAETKRRDEADKLKQQRREQQAENVKRKEKLKQAHRKRCIAGAEQKEVKKLKKEEDFH